METLKSLMIDPLRELFTQVTGFVPTLLSALLVLIVGVVVAKVVHDLFHRICKEIKVDLIADKVGLAKILHKGGVKKPVSGLLSSLVHVITIVMFFLMAVETIGLTMMKDLIDKVVAYVPQVVSACIVLVLGMIIAKIVSSIIHVVAHATDMPKPHLFEKISRWAIVLYAATISLEELGYGMLLVGKSFHILFAGIVLAYAIAFGFGGRDTAAKILTKK